MWSCLEDGRCGRVSEKHLSVDEAAMSSVESLRDFVTERLTAAAEEIFRVFKQTVVEYEEEIGRQRRLLDTVLKPEIRLHRTELPQQHASQEEEEEEEVLSSLEQEQPEPPQIKEEEEEVGRQRRLLDMVLKPEIRLHRTELPQQHASQEEEEVLSSLEQEQPEPPQIKEEAEEIGRQRRLLDMVLKPEIRLHRTELPQQHVCQEEEEEEEEPEPPQIKEEEEEVCSSQEGEQLLLKQETDSLMVTPTHEGSEHREPEPTSEQQLLSHSSPVADNQHQEGSGHVDPEPPGNVETQPQKRRRTNSSDNVHNSPPAKSHCDTETGKRSVSPGNVGMKSNTVTPQPFNTFVQRFIHNSSLKTHEGNHKGSQVYSCKTCGRHLKTRRNLMNHMRTHTDQKPFVCNTCGKIFRHKSSLSSHMKIHTFGTCGNADSTTARSSVRTGEGQYTCDTCGKGFFKTYRLKEHILIHTGEKPHICGTCGRGFRRKGDLTVHIRTHTGEKPYSCDTCGNRFQRSSHVKNHMKVHRLKA